MKMKPPSGPKKTNPNKPNFFKGQNELKIACPKIWPHPGVPKLPKFIDLEKKLCYYGTLSLQE